MLTFEGASIPKLYPQILQAILDNGLEVGPRGMKTKELGPVTLVSYNPRQRLFGYPTRRDVSLFTYIEGLWILLGEEAPSRVVPYVKNMANYVNEKTGVFDGAYGPRLRSIYTRRSGMKYVRMDQFKLCYQRLKEDKDSRRVVMVINNPILDWDTTSKDIPCTMLFQFLIRRDQLDMIVYMRSQDAWLGLVYDTGEFQWFQEILAGWLNLEVGRYTHIDGSLHLYDWAWDKAKQLIEQDANWDLYSKAEILDARLPKEVYDKIEKGLGTWEKSCRLGQYDQVKNGLLDNANDFYCNLMDVILAYNFKLNGIRLSKEGRTKGRREKGVDMIEEASKIIAHNQSDLGLIYRNRWLKEWP